MLLPLRCTCSRIDMRWPGRNHRRFEPRTRHRPRCIVPWICSHIGLDSKPRSRNTTRPCTHRSRRTQHRLCTAPPGRSCSSPTGRVRAPVKRHSPHGGALARKSSRPTRMPKAPMAGDARRPGWSPRSSPNVKGAIVVAAALVVASLSRLAAMAVRVRVRSAVCPAPPDHGRRHRQARCASNG